LTFVVADSAPLRTPCGVHSFRSVAPPLLSQTLRWFGFELRGNGFCPLRLCFLNYAGLQKFFSRYCFCYPFIFACLSTGLSTIILRFCFSVALLFLLLSSLYSVFKVQRQLTIHI
jgi:hypothetical protein